MEKQDTHSDASNIYELGYILVPTIAEESVATEVQTVKALLEKYEASVITEDFPKLRPLAYTMRKASGSEYRSFDKGYFGWIKFETSAQNVPKIKFELDKNEGILRFMLISTVRENTMVTQKMVFKPLTEGSKKEDGVEEEKAPEVSEAEMDKTIENLVVE